MKGIYYILYIEYALYFIFTTVILFCFNESAIFEPAIVCLGILYIVDTTYYFNNNNSNNNIQGTKFF